MIKVDIFGTETEWKPIKKYGVTLPGYFVNREGEILSETRVAYRYYGGTLKDGKDYKKTPHKGWVSHIVPARILSSGKTYQIRNTSKGKSKKGLAHTKVSLSIPFDTFKDSGNEFNYSLSSNHNTLPHEKSPLQFSVTVHKCVKNAFHPFDDHTDEVGISKNEWNKTPESVRSIVRECIYIDHIDDDPSNNKLSNLKYKTPKTNNYLRKKQLG